MYPIPTWLPGSSAILAGLLLAISCTPTVPVLEQPCRGVAGDLVVTEIMPDPAGEDGGKEYVEIFNASSADIKLEGFSLFHAAASGSGEKRVLLTAATIPAAGYFVLGNAPDAKPPHLDYGYAEKLGALRNAGGRIGLRCGAKVIDEVVYGDVMVGHARELDGTLVPDSAANDNPANWCNSRGRLDELPPAGESFGTPGAPNGTCADAAVPSCEDVETGEPRPIVTPTDGDLVITEVMANPAATGDADGEWVELYAKKDLDLNSLTLRSGAGKFTLSSSSCVRVPSDVYVLLAHDDDPRGNGGLPPVTAAVGVSMPNGPSFLALESGESVIDELAWTSAPEGVALQLSANALDASREERTSSFCLASAPYGRGDKGTPGVANEPCPVVVGQGECLDSDTGKPRLIDKPKPFELLVTEIMARSGRVPDADGEWFEVLVRASTDLNGLELANDASGKATLSSVECMRAEPGSYLLFARKPDPSVNGGLPQVHATFGFALANTGTRAVVLRSEGVVIDRVGYTGATQGVSIQLSAAALDPVLSDDPTSWCAPPPDQTYGLGDRGTPGAPNVACDAAVGAGGSGGTSGGTDGGSGATATGGGGAGDGGGGDFSGQCLDPESGVPREPIRPAPGDLVITEIMAAPTVGNGGPGEWFEVLANADVDLNGLVLANEGTGSVALVSASCLSTLSGAYLLFGRSDNPEHNGALPPITAVFAFGLADSASDTYPERAVILRLDDNELDRAIWTKSTKGVSLQVSADKLDTSAGDPSAWCLTPAGATFGAGERATPGAENLVCP